MKEGELYGEVGLCGKLNKQNKAEGGGDDKKNEKEKRQTGGWGGHL